MKNMIHTSRVATLLSSLVISILLSGLLAPQLAQAATGTWTGAGGATWDINATNWSGVSGTPWDSTNGSGNTALFSGAATPTVSGTVYVNTITFNAATTLNGGTITLAGSSPTINGTDAATINSALAGTNGLTKSGSGSVTLSHNPGLSGNITINGGVVKSNYADSLGDGAGAITLDGAGLYVDWNSVTRTGLVTLKNWSYLWTSYGAPVFTNNGAGIRLESNSQIGGAFKFAGSGGLTVANGWGYVNNSGHTYTGPTVIESSGALTLDYSGDLPSTTAVQVDGYWQLAGGSAPAIVSRTIAGLTGAGVISNDTGGTKTLTVNKTSGSDTFSGEIRNVTSFVKAGAGTLTLTHANNSLYNGSTTVSDGLLELGGAGRLAAGSYSGAISLSSSSSVLGIATSANQGLSGAISGSGSLTKSGAGTLTLSGTNSYTGNTTISGGNLVASSANALGDAAGAVTVSGGASLYVNANMTRTGTVTIDASTFNLGIHLAQQAPRCSVYS